MLILVYMVLGKMVFSLVTMLITLYKQEVHLTYPSSLLSIGSRETLETLRSLDVTKRAIRHLRVYTFSPKKIIRMIRSKKCFHDYL